MALNIKKRPEKKYRDCFDLGLLHIFLMIFLSILLLPSVSFAQEQGIATSGEITVGVQQVDNDKDSAKFNEYRDIDDGFYLYKLNMDIESEATGMYLEFRGTNLSRDDQNAVIRMGKYGLWELEMEWDEIPHLYGTNAKSFYSGAGGNRLTAPDAVRSALNITTVDNSFTDNYIGTLKNNIANADYFRNIDIDVQRRKGRVALKYNLMTNLNFNVEFSNEQRDGAVKTGAAIAASSYSRTLAVELPEPVDYTTQDIKAGLEYAGEDYQVQLSYYLSIFKNDYDSLEWDNLYISDQAGGYKKMTGSNRTVADTGRMALPPDNTYNNVSLSFGINLPLDSRLTGSASYGVMKQDENLLPYSTSRFNSNIDWSSVNNAYLPRTKADAEKTTKSASLKYIIAPVTGLYLAPFYKYYSMENKTPKDEWLYITADGINADPSLANYKPGDIYNRYNMPYDYDRQNMGIDATYNLSRIIKRTTIGFGYEREEYDREFRAVSKTDEDMYKASFMTRPLEWLSFRAKYLYGDREGSSYKNGSGFDGDPLNQSYVKYSTMANDSVPWSNNPDLRQYDIADRERNRIDASVQISPVQNFSLSLSHVNTDDDYDVGGQTFGLEKDRSRATTVDVVYQPIERLNTYAYYTNEQRKIRQSGRAYEHDQAVKETNRGESMGGMTWWDPDTNWLVNQKDDTDTIGIGFTAAVMPGKLDLYGDSSYSKAKVKYDTTYGPMAAANVEDPPALEKFKWTPSSDIKNKLVTLNAGVKYYPIKKWTVGFNYLYEKYDTSNWAQEPMEDNLDYKGWDTPSLSGRSSNVLVGLGSLTSDYETHTGMVTVAYRW